MSDSHKYVYSFGGGKAEGKADMKALLGGKGANLAEMSVIGIPVPPGFTITTEVCAAYYENGKKLPEAVRPQVEAAIQQVEKQLGARLGDPADPLLVSVRSGAALSMPGMMNTILNLGLSDVSTEGLAKKTGNVRFAYDGYRRLIDMFGSVVMGVDHELFEHELAAPQEGARGPARHRALRRRPQAPGPEVQGGLQEGDRLGLPPGPQGPALGGDHGRLQ